MDQDKAIAKALDPEALKHVPGARIVDVKWRHYVDHLGEPSLEVWVILDETITDEELLSGVVTPVERAIFDRLEEASVTLFPYLRYAKQSELDELEATV
jgi:hypothetical protein